MLSVNSISGAMNMASILPQNLREVASKAGLEQIGELDATKLTSGATAASGTTKAASSEPFGSMINRFVSDVDSQMKTAGSERAKVLSGETTNLHQAVIASQEASVGFSLMVELRNKLVESYQELMRSAV